MRGKPGLTDGKPVCSRNVKYNLEPLALRVIENPIFRVCRGASHRIRIETTPSSGSCRLEVLGELGRICREISLVHLENSPSQDEDAKKGDMETGISFKAKLN